MKGNEAEYTVPLQWVFTQPKTKRLRKAVAELRRFAVKHSRAEKVLVSNEVNEFINRQSIHLPRRIEVVLFRHKGEEEEVRVFLKGGKGLAEEKKRKAEDEKKKKKEKEEKEKKTAEEKKAEKAKEEEEAKKLEEKREKEKAAQKAEIKMK
ncbi:MAG: hypothetical protein V1494_03340 [Candidatus Diapherotrites archaeon]